MTQKQSQVLVTCVLSWPSLLGFWKVSGCVTNIRWSLVSMCRPGWGERAGLRACNTGHFFVTHFPPHHPSYHEGLVIHVAFPGIRPMNSESLGWSEGIDRSHVSTFVCSQGESGLW